MLSVVHWQRLCGSLTRAPRRYGHTGYAWPPRAFGPIEPGPPIEPSHIRGEGKFLFPESLKKKYGGKFKMPPIKDLSRAAKRVYRRKLWHTKVENLQTIEEKIFELNMPRYYGWMPYVMREGELTYDPLPKIQYMTRTCLMKELGLPSYYDSLLSEEELNATVQQIKGQIEEALVFEYNAIDKNYQLTEDELEDELFMKNFKAKAVSRQVNRVLMNHLSGKYQHLMEAEVDFDPRLEAFWFFGGFHPPPETVKSRDSNDFLRELKDEPVNQPLQYYGTPLMHIRHNLPLREFMPLEQSNDFRLEIPYEPHDLRTEGYFRDLKRATVIPGFWPGDPSEFGFISYNSSAHLATRPKHMNDNADALTSQAILGSYSWLYAQACYQGFSTFQDTTYPLVNQMIITNGQYWTFSVYQLNTTVMHLDAINQNKKCNVCWMTDSMKLFDSVENGKVEGLNEDVLKHLVKFYTNTPQVRKGVNMKPFLSGEQVIANIDDPERRCWLEDRYKHLMSNRERHRPMPEIKDWQRIYMIKFNTRPMDKKRDPWEFGKNPHYRRLDDHAPIYIPRCLREHHRSKKKFRKDYYPEVPEEKFEKWN